MGSVVSAASEVEIAARMVRRLEDLEAVVSGVTVAQARVKLARALQATTSVVRHIRNLRRKSIPAALYARLYGVTAEWFAGYARQFEHEIAKLAANNQEADLGGMEATLSDAEFKLSQAHDLLRVARAHAEFLRRASARAA